MSLAVLLWSMDQLRHPAQKSKWLEERCWQHWRLARPAAQCSRGKGREQLPDHEEVQDLFLLRGEGSLKQESTFRAAPSGVVRPPPPPSIIFRSRGSSRDVV